LTLIPALWTGGGDQFVAMVGCQRYGSSSSIRLAGCVGSR